MRHIVRNGASTLTNSYFSIRFFLLWCWKSGTCMNSEVTVQFLHSLQGHFLGFHFLIAFSKELRDANSLIPFGTPDFRTQYDMLSVP